MKFVIETPRLLIRPALNFLVLWVLRKIKLLKLKTRWEEIRRTN